MDFDVILVGGGLANSLIALRLAGLRPETRIAVVDQNPQICGDHTWSFQDTDVTDAQRAWMQPAVIAHWPDQKVIFPKYERVLSMGYNSMRSDRLRAALAHYPAITPVCGVSAEILDPETVLLSDGRRLRAPCVIDGAGFSESPYLRLGYQKFYGVEFEYDAPHGVDRPVIMDATFTQFGGYRFVYLLPFTPTRLLIEDTYYTDGPQLNEEAVRARVVEYAEAKGLAGGRPVHEEKGVLPIALAQNARKFWANVTPGIPRVGMRAALFHATTGYSVPMATRAAEVVAETEPLTSAALFPRIRDHAIAEWKRQTYFRMLNRFLFLAARPEERFHVFQFFYTKPQDTVERFYAGQLSAIDKVRLVWGKPPVPILRAMAAMPEAPQLRAATA